jgi:hypothetical protein
MKPGTIVLPSRSIWRVRAVASGRDEGDHAEPVQYGQKWQTIRLDDEKQPAVAVDPSWHRRYQAHYHEPAPPRALQVARTWKISPCPINLLPNGQPGGAGDGRVWLEDVEDRTCNC